MAVGFDSALSNLVSLLFLSVLVSFPQLMAAVNDEEDHVHRQLAVTDNVPGGFISIDCGAYEDYTDRRYGIRYKTDKDFTVSGVNKQVSPQFFGGLEEQYTNLRSFPEGIRNCYTIKPAAIGAGNKYLIRGYFAYGNYDGKSESPSFDLFLGVNIWWATLDWNYTYSEVIFVHSDPTDYIDVCLVKTGNSVPYISTLELRPLLDNHSSIYEAGQNGQALLIKNRYDMGPGNWQRRYPEDVYDRFWEVYNCEELESSSSYLITTNETVTEGNDDPYKLPVPMLKTACTTLNSSVPLNIKWSTQTGASSYYFCFHFMEIQNLKAGLVREMSIVLNGQTIITRSIKLYEYLKPQTLCSKGFPVNPGQVNTLSISSTSSSILPPILNGLEILYSIDTPNSPTFFPDIKAIMDIRQRYKVRRNWQGDPCNPPTFLWDGLNCSNDTPSRIISLNLSNSNLSGSISLSFSTLSAMEHLDLSYNELKGPLPEALAQLPQLKILNLTGNKLTGAIPETLLQKFKDGTLVLSLEGNSDLCWSFPCHKKKEWAIPILSSVIAALVLFILLGIIVIFTRKSKRSKEKSIDSKGSLKLKNRQYSYFEVVSITYNFKVVIGEGGFGKVYLGALEDQTMVAVKVLSPSSQQGCKEFQAEAQLLMIVHHRNLVSLLGYCDEGDHKALIYEYMVNGNLKQHLSETSTNTNPLSWNERLRIAVDAAHGLEYLHNGCRPPIVHRDLKPANILLDKEMQAKIADFGLSRTFATGTESQILTRLVGTPGYLDLENQKCGNIDKKSDIYSFGIILLELITGCPAISKGSGGAIHILDWVNSKIKTGDIQHIIDWKLQGEFDQNSAWKILEIAISCTQSITVQRPDMSHVLEELKECLAVDQNTPTASLIMSTRILAESETAPCLR